MMTPTKAKTLPEYEWCRWCQHEKDGRPNACESCEGVERLASCSECGDRLVLGQAYQHNRHEYVCGIGCLKDVCDWPTVIAVIKAERDEEWKRALGVVDVIDGVST